MSEYTVLEEVGDPAFGASLRQELGAYGQVRGVAVPGHDGIPAGFLQSAELALTMLDVTPTCDVLVGVGTSGWCAQLFGLAGRVERLVLIDALGGPWLTVDEQMARSRARRRRILTDSDSMHAPPPTGFDPRARHGLWSQHNRALAEESAAALDVPVLVVDTGAGSLSADEVTALVSRMPHGDHVRLSTRNAAETAGAIASWSAEAGVRP